MKSLVLLFLFASSVAWSQPGSDSLRQPVDSGGVQKKVPLVSDSVAVSDSPADTAAGQVVEQPKAGDGEKDRETGEENKGAPDLSSIISWYKIFWAMVFLVLGYLVISFLTRLLKMLAERSTSHRITIKSFVPIVKIVGWLFLIFIVVVGIFQPPVSTVLTFSATLGVAIGFASQDILKNIFGGVMILLDRPFQAGDKIEVGKYYGEVVEIGLRSTRIVTPDDSLVSIPNSEIMNSSVSNANAGEPNCQVVAEIYLPGGADTIRSREIALQAAQISKYVYLNKPIVVLFEHEFVRLIPILKMKIKAYVADIRDEFKFKSDMTELVVRELIREGILHE